MFEGLVKRVEGSDRRPLWFPKGFWEVSCQCHVSIRALYGQRGVFKYGLQKYCDFNEGS